MSGKKIYLTVLICSTLLCAVVFALTIKSGEKKEISQISFFCRESAEEYSKTSLKQGIEQGAKDFGVELTVQFLNNSGSPEELAALLEKEMENKTDAILIEPVNEESVLTALRECAKKVPVVMVNAGIEGADEFPVISCSHRQVGLELAAKILEKAGKDKKVLLAASPMVFQDTSEAYQGLQEGLEGSCELEYLELSGDDREKEEMLEERLGKEDIHAVAVLCSRDLSMMGKLKRIEKCPDSVLIYGMGKNNQIIADMEEGLTEAIGVVNYYSVGYLSVQEAILGNTDEKEVMASIIDKDHIYTPESQRILFTLVQ